MKLATQTSKVKQVYQELKRVYGDEFPVGELLRQAAKFVQFVERVNDVEAEFLRSTDSRSLNPSLDVAFADGGWMLLNRERDWGGMATEDATYVPKSVLRKRYPVMESSLFPRNPGALAEEWVIKNEE
ncbi:hypothetical protein RJ527_18580 [Thalassospiraceae bacterium LMO-SO8]|nr:hypothetical protein [Alphaproteobacteria bacterium LMO-S08]WND76014.1 hypothetical protein RJ527_18580 [Thalassospiraceae bacterium LMO-SO8]